MARENLFHCQLITPDAALADELVSSVVVTAHDGELGVLRDRAPLLCRLGVGGLRMQTPTGTRQFFIDGGFMQVYSNELVILTPQARPIDQIPVQDTQRQLKEWQEKTAHSLAEQETKDVEVRRLRAQLRLAVKNK
ncbi:MAG: ATP synthase epsilon chain, sodium ion specific [Phycisphaerae bacterium]|nr:ATP synthase epsilon chain, sodium ion specific [Phycisphaerae bacterium]